jgi:tetratricopeptide (TPR) repeat protein
MARPSLLAAALALGGMGFAGSVKADDVDDTLKKLIELDQRVHVMALELREAPPPPPDIADRRVLDAQVLYSLKNYEDAATISLDVVEKYPGSRAHDDALVLLGESLFQVRDFYSARHYLQEAVAKNTGSRQEQQALQRLVEISLRTGDFDNVDSYLARLQNLPPALMEPATPYVRGKYYYYRSRLDDAALVFASIPQTNPYFFQARYFLATIAVKKGDLASATQGYDALLKTQAPDAGSRDVQDLSRLAIARILYERSQFDKAIEAYLSIPRQSKYWPDALREQAWTYIKAKDWQRAYRSLNLLLLADPDVPDGPDLRILEGNLQLRMSNFYLASDTFSKVRDEFEPIHRQLNQVIVRSQTDPAYFDNLIGKSLDKFDIGAFVPPTAAKWVKAEPDVARMMVLASDMGDMQRDLAESQKLLDRIQHVMNGKGRVGIFPDLASHRTKSTEIMNQLVGTRQKFAVKIRQMIEPLLSPEDKRQLDQLGMERDGLEKQLSGMPTTDEGVLAHERTMKEQFADIDKQASELNVQIQAMEAELVAIENYYRVSRSEQKIRPEDIRGPVHDMRATIEELRGMHDKLREARGAARPAPPPPRGRGAVERETTRKLSDTLQRELAIEKPAIARLTGSDRLLAERMVDLLGRCDAIDGQLRSFDQRVDTQVSNRLELVNQYLAAGKEELASASEKLGSIMEQSKSMGGGLAQAMFTKVASSTCPGVSRIRRPRRSRA